MYTIYTLILDKKNPDIKIPRHFVQVKFCSRNTCLCSRHQNIALKIKAMQDVAGTKNPDNFIRNNGDDMIQEKLRQLEQSDVKFAESNRGEENGINQMEISSNQYD